MNGFAWFYNLLFPFRAQVKIGHILLRKPDRKGYTHKTSWIYLKSVFFHYYNCCRYVESIYAWLVLNQTIENKNFGEAYGNSNFLGIYYFLKSQLFLAHSFLFRRWGTYRKCIWVKLLLKTPGKHAQKFNPIQNASMSG